MSIVGYSGKDANLRNSFVDNEVIEGNHVWNYNTNQPALPGGFPCALLLAARCCCSSNCY
eukprot:COSAG06_NODE_2088_length_7616_cov_2.737395_8_plen_60_part_00